MLILTRKTGKAVRIGDSIEIYILEVKGDLVRLGIQAPRDVAIVRHEMVDLVRNQNREAAEEVEVDILDGFSDLTLRSPKMGAPKSSINGARATSGSGVANLKHG